MVERIGDDVRMHPVGPLHGSVRPPGSKSLTNRYLLCAALTDGVSTLRGVTVSEDVQAMMGGLGALGFRVETDEAHGDVRVRGENGRLPADDADIDAGNAGTAMRFLAALACVGYGRYRLDGSPRMRARPIGALVGALQQLGSGIGYEGREGFPPLTIDARGLRGGAVRFARPPSSQFISALLMVAPYAGDDVLIEVAGGAPSAPYIDMTLSVMQSLGVEALTVDRTRFVVPAPQRYRAASVDIEPDASAATYFWAAAAITGGSVRVGGLTRGSRQGDVGFVEVLRQMGCEVAEGPDFLAVRGPGVGKLHGIDVDLNAMPDTVQTLAVVALFADEPTRIRNVANLRLKETDRLAALGHELSRLGALVELQEDGLTITPPHRVTPAAIETYNDHRMAMSFALAGLAADGVVIRNAGCVRKSFPTFFETLSTLE